jgi:homopolymeric O-antigen transport system permease protein
MAASAPASARPLGPVTVIAPSSGWIPVRFSELWRHRELLYFFAWRDLKIRYAQTLFGAIWTVFQPLALILVFTLAFRRLGRVDTEGLPYPVFAFAGLVFWTFFSRAVALGASSLVANSQLLTKTSLPRLLIPISSITSGLVDFLIGLIVYLILALGYGVHPTWRIAALPAVLALGLTFAVAMILILSATNVRYRDVGQALPFLIQLWLFLSPVAYPLSRLGGSLETILAFNPLVGIIEAFRWSIAGGSPPSELALVVSLVGSFGLFVLSIFYFARVERTFADVV